MQLIEITQENRNNSGIYCITNTIDDRIYIGSCKKFNLRIKSHINSLLKNKHANIYLQNFVNKYGIESIKFHIIEFSEIINLVNTEQYYLDSLNPQFNICKKAYQPPVKYSLTEEQINQIATLYNKGNSGCKIAEIMFNDRNKRTLINKLIKGEIYTDYSHLFIYRKYSQIGRKYTQETKDKISKANRGNLNLGGKGTLRKGNGKLSKETVIFIRENHKVISQSKLALQFNISKSLVKDIQMKRTYNKF